MLQSLLSARSCSACSSAPAIIIWIYDARRFGSFQPPGVFHAPSPCVARDALAGVAAGDVGELALESSRERETVQQRENASAFTRHSAAAASITNLRLPFPSGSGLHCDAAPVFIRALASGLLRSGRHRQCFCNALSDGSLAYAGLGEYDTGPDETCADPTGTSADGNRAIACASG